MPMVRTRLGHDVHDCPAGPPQFSPVRVRRYAELLHDLVRELVWGAIPSSGLPEEAVVVVRAVDEVARLVAANSAESQIAVRSRGQPARILCDARGQQRQIGE